jgi:hypothetical protein
MPHLAFKCPDQQKIAGCLEAFMMYIPFDPRGQVNTQQGPMSGAQVAWSLALQDCANKRIPLPPNASFQPELISPAKDKGEAPFIYMVQVTQPTADRVQTNAVEGMPVGNGYNLTPPPVLQPQNAQRANPMGTYDMLPDCALAANSDSMMGEMDGLGGTWTDVDSSGREVVRPMYIEPSKPVAGR